MGGQLRWAFVPFWQPSLNVLPIVIAVYLFVKNKLSLSLSNNKSLHFVEIDWIYSGTDCYVGMAANNMKLFLLIAEFCRRFICCVCTMSFLGKIANSLAEKVKRAAGVVPPYEVVESTALQFSKLFLWLIQYSLPMFFVYLDSVGIYCYELHVIDVATIYFFVVAVVLML